MEINDSIVDSLREELSNDENTIALMNLQETLERCKLSLCNLLNYDAILSSIILCTFVILFTVTH